MISFDATATSWYRSLGLPSLASLRSRRITRHYGRWLMTRLGLYACFIAVFWLAVAIAGLDGVRRWSGDPILVRIETAILVIAAVALMGTTALRIAISFGALGLLTIPWPSFFTRVAYLRSHVGIQFGRVDRGLRNVGSSNYIRGNGCPSIGSRLSVRAYRSSNGQLRLPTQLRCGRLPPVQRC